MRSRTRIAIVTVGMVSATAVGVALAAWTAIGTGTGKAKAITAVTSTVTATTAAAELYPGAGQIGDVTFTIDNPNPYPISFSEITAMSVVSDDTTNCPTANVSVPAASAGTPYSISAIARAANAAASAATIADLVTMAFGAPDGCQGATFTVTLTLRGIQTA